MESDSDKFFIESRLRPGIGNDRDFQGGGVFFVQEYFDRKFHFNFIVAKSS